MGMYIQFPDKVVSYDTFMDDLSSRIVRKMQRAEADPKTVSQRKAYSIFGRANVDRWRREGRVQPCKRPGKVEYNMADLRLLQQTQQDSNAKHYEIQRTPNRRSRPTQRRT